MHVIVSLLAFRLQFLNKLELSWVEFTKTALELFWSRSKIICVEEELKFLQ